MEMSLSINELAPFVRHQLNAFFPDRKSVDDMVLSKFIDLSIQRLEFCFSKVKDKYFSDGKEIYFNHLHADQYAMFLYFLSNTMYRGQAPHQICNKLFQLNRALHAVDVFYEVDLPKIFLFRHPLGTVLGRASYSNYFLVYQNCNVGSNQNIYPVLHEHVSLYPGASVLGNCNVAHNCKIAAGSILLDRSLEKDSLYIGNPKSYTILKRKQKSQFWK